MCTTSSSDVSLPVHMHTHTHSFTWGRLETVGSMRSKTIPQDTCASWFTSGSNLSAYKRVCCREITARQDAVQELCSGTCAGLLRLRETLARCPDLEKGLCSIYHSKVWGTWHPLLHLPQQGVGSLAISAPFTTARYEVLSNFCSIYHSKVWGT